MLFFLLSFFAYLTSISSIDAVVHNFYWRDYIHGDIPCDAFQGAPGKYIGQVNIKEHNLVATINPITGTAIASWEGMKTTKLDIKILCTPEISRFYWEHVDFDKSVDDHLVHAVKGGFQDPQHSVLFIGKLLNDGEWKIGKVHGNEYGAPAKGLWLWDQNQQSNNFHQFYLLKYNTTDACRRPCSNNY